MDKLYQSLIAILGRPSADPAFVELLKVLQENPETLRKSKTGYDLLFPKSGVQFAFDEKHNRFSSIFFHFETAMVESGAVTRYEHDLLAGIRFGDHRATVEQKLGRKPIASNLIPGRTPEQPKNLWECYDMGTLELVFMFSPADELGSLSVRLITAGSPEIEPREPETYINQVATSGLLSLLRAASEEARRLDCNFIESGEILLALLAEPESDLALLLHQSGLSYDRVLVKVKEMVAPSKNLDEKTHYTIRSKCILEKSVEESAKLGSTKVHPEHLLLALIDEGEGIAARIFQIFEVDLNALRSKVLGLCKPNR
jgi:hypothetical protein